MLFELPPTTLAVLNTQERFCVRRIFCIGRNYAEHAKEMGADAARGDRPVIFTKPADAIVASGASVPYPPATQNLHHEVELVVALHSGGKEIPEAQALEHVFGYAVGNDLTRRDLQLSAKKAGLPWDIGKAFDASAPCGAIARCSEIGHPSSGEISLSVNGTLRQCADLSELLWSVSEIIHELSRLFELKAGDLIFSGTPAGVSALKRGDVVHAHIAGVGTLEHSIG